MIFKKSTFYKTFASGGAVVKSLQHLLQWNLNLVTLSLFVYKMEGNDKAFEDT